MRKFHLYSVVCLSLLIVLSSCTMEKRQYSSGYHIQWKGDKKELTNKNSVAASVKEDKIKLENPSEVIDEKVVASSQEVIVSEETDNSIVNETNETASLGNEITVIPANSFLSKSNKTSTSTSTTIDSKKSRIQNLSTFYKKQIPNKVSKESSAPKGGKSKMIALILCIFLGGLGVHRFYLGYTGIGVLMLFTAGVFGILWIIDLIRIITGSLKPKDGEYSN